MLQQVKMAEHRDAFGKGLSRGMMQRVVLAKTLIPRPKILLLDEPASGLDPLARINLKNILVDICGQGVTAIVSSHILTELADMCTSIGIMHKGELVKTGDINNILIDHPINTRCLTALMSDAVQDSETINAILTANDFVEDVAQQGDTFVLGFCGDQSAEAELLKELVLQGIRVTSFSRESATMEDVLISLVSPDHAGEMIGENEVKSND
tara:strand:+ start:2919 stop:3551 length:633 start_codon:yes stop_codon:yes gene_type:complete